MTIQYEYVSHMYIMPCGCILFKSRTLIKGCQAPAESHLMVRHLRLSIITTVTSYKQNHLYVCLLNCSVLEILGRAGHEIFRSAPIPFSFCRTSFGHFDSTVLLFLDYPLHFLRYCIILIFFVIS